MNVEQIEITPTYTWEQKYAPIIRDNIDTTISWLSSLFCTHRDEHVILRSTKTVRVDNPKFFGTRARYQLITLPHDEQYYQCSDCGKILGQIYNCRRK